MKIFALPPGENWICDRFVSEWNHFNQDISTTNPFEADMIWLLADWCWNQVPKNLLQKTVIVSVHHITPDKFGHKEVMDFVARDKFVNVYHVPCEKTAEQIRHLTKKPIYVQPFWVNQSMWFEDKDSASDFRDSLNLSDDAFLIGSFQRDTEGHDLKSPKLEKGPDLFCDVVEKISKERNVEVLLGGWRRQYVMSRLDSEGIKYHYFELPDFASLNTMYNSLDLYIVAARYEGGPQAIVECASTKTPIISTDVGIAPDILPNDNIFDPDEFDVTLINNPIDVDTAFKNVQNYWIPEGFKWFRAIFESVGGEGY